LAETWILPAYSCLSGTTKTPNNFFLRKFLTFILSLLFLLFLSNLH
jgi:hypothetical protein